ncbi:MAG TPA: glutathione S-transferase C-terminal domain-containing protein [Reyranella sp.]|nr:glutathione S-transferase C-terminal domain-containing protein [Reyranella sp.]
MPVHYVSVEEAIARDGLRMVVVGGVPSPWGEAAKGILHMKGIDWVGVRLAYDDDAQRQWAGQRSGPIAIYDKEPPRAGWAEILLLAERLAPQPSLLPTDAAERATMFGLAHEICGQEGLGWTRRLHLIHAGAFGPHAGQYLARKYGYSPAAGIAAPARVAALLRMLSSRLAGQRQSGSPYYLGTAPTAVDVYSATCLALFRPLPPEHCPMDEALRSTFSAREPTIDAALDPILLEHRDMMYARHLELPLSL